jgi:hypothetical protein
MIDHRDDAVYRYIVAYGPITAATIATGLGQDAAQIAAIIARLLDARFVVVARVNSFAEPMYATASASKEPT